MGGERRGQLRGIDPLDRRPLDLPVDHHSQPDRFGRDPDRRLNVKLVKPDPPRLLQRPGDAPVAGDRLNRRLRADRIGRLHHRALPALLEADRRRFVRMNALGGDRRRVGAHRLHRPQQEGDEGRMDGEIRPIGGHGQTASKDPPPAELRLGDHRSVVVEPGQHRHRRDRGRNGSVGRSLRAHFRPRR